MDELINVMVNGKFQTKFENKIGSGRKMIHNVQEWISYREKKLSTFFGE